MSETSIKSTILGHIKDSKKHSVFFTRDFTEQTTPENVKKILREACAVGLLKRVAQGIYVKPMNSRFGEVPLPMEVIAQEIADRDHVQIMPTGSTATNIVGLSTQVPMITSFITTGSSRTIKIGNQIIKFRHAAPRNFAYKGKTIPLLVQALKEIEQTNIHNAELFAISQYMNRVKDKETFASDILIAPQWIRGILRPIIMQITQL